MSENNKEETTQEKKSKKSMFSTSFCGSETQQCNESDELKNEVYFDAIISVCEANFAPYEPILPKSIPVFFEYSDFGGEPLKEKWVGPLKR